MYTKALVTSPSESTAGSGLPGDETSSFSSAMIRSSVVIPNSTALKHKQHTSKLGKCYNSITVE